MWYHFTAAASSTAFYPIVDPYGAHALGCRRSLPHRTTFWHDPLRDAYASIGRMVGLRTRTEVTGMIPDNSKRPDVVFTTDDGTEIITDVVTCCPVLMSASANNCAHSATTIGAANASGITSKHQAWGPSLRDLPYEFYALAHEPGRISDTALSLLDRLISRLPTNDRPRLRTYAHQLLAATTALGVARVIRAGLPIRCDSSNRVLPTPGDAIPSNGLPPRPPPGQFRSRSPDRTTPFLATNHPANTPDSPESPRFLLRESPPDQPVAVEEALHNGVRVHARVLQLQHGCPSQRKGANTAIEARLQVLSDVGLPPTTATKRSRRAGYYTNETHLHRALKPCGLQQQQTASTGLSVFELRRGSTACAAIQCS